jgi:diguanylate cyclase (GGDEF)-like protein
MTDVDALSVPMQALRRLMPMSVLVAGTGHIAQVGPTLTKLRPGAVLEGARFLELFEFRRPRNVASMAALRALAGVNLALRFRDDPATSFKGQAADLGEAGILINLSLGIAAVDAVGRFHLTNADFAPTDLTVEMLYLVEAKEAVLNESRSLNRRLQGARIAAEEQAFTDTLTGLKNRRAMDTILDRYTAAGEEFGLMHLDLDYFKDVNDTLGHAAGDHVLQQVAKILVEETRAGDTVIRAGGDEFVLVFHDLTSAEALAAISDRLLKRLEQPILFGGAPCRISASIGIALSNDYVVPEAERMLGDADRALYASKNAGRARHTFFNRIDPSRLQARVT